MGKFQELSTKLALIFVENKIIDRDSLDYVIDALDVHAERCLALLEQPAAVASVPVGAVIIEDVEHDV